jgi:hypothetical protein
MKITQHIPGFVTGREPERAEVSSLAELLELPWVAHWKTHENFHRDRSRK